MKSTWVLRLSGQQEREIVADSKEITFNGQVVEVEKFGRRRTFNVTSINANGQQVTDTYVVVPLFSLMTLFLKKSLYLNNVNVETGHVLTGRSSKLSTWEIAFWIILHISYVICYVAFMYFPVGVGIFVLCAIVIFCLINFFYHLGKRVVITKLPLPINVAENGATNEIGLLRQQQELQQQPQQIQQQPIIYIPQPYLQQLPQQVVPLQQLNQQQQPPYVTYIDYSQVAQPNPYFPYPMQQTQQPMQQPYPMQQPIYFNNNFDQTSSVPSYIIQQDNNSENHILKEKLIN